MYIRIVQVKVDPAKSEEFLETYHNVLMPRLRDVQGCLSARLARSSKDRDEFLSMTLWASQEEAEAYGTSPVFQELLGVTKQFLADSTEWKVQLSKDLTLEYETVEKEPVIRSYPVIAEVNAKTDMPEDSSTMHVRIVSPKIKAGMLEEFKTLYHNRLIPILLKTPGCRYAYLAENRQEEEDILSITIWDSKEDADNYEKSGLFQRLTEMLEHTLSDLYQWKLSLGRYYGKKLITSDDLKVDHYEVIEGKKFQ